MPVDWLTMTNWKAFACAKMMEIVVINFIASGRGQPNRDRLQCHQSCQKHQSWIIINNKLPPQYGKKCCNYYYDKDFVKTQP